MNDDFKDPYEAADDATGDTPDAMTLDMIAGGEAGGFEDFSRPNKGGSKGMLVLLLAVVVGGGALWAMRMAGSDGPIDGASGDAEEKVEAALARLSDDDSAADPAETTRHALDVLFRDTDEVIAMFADDPTHKQVGLDELKKNPFKLLIARGDKDEDEPAPVDDAERQREQRLAQLEAERARLKLQSVLTGDPSVAVIDDQVLRVGDEVGPFEIVSIGRQGVRMTAEGETFTLKLASPEDANQSLRR